ncbi:MAG: hypothetical protein ACRECR_07070 [Thermoplasmata archaeon]
MNSSHGPAGSASSRAVALLLTLTLALSGVLLLGAGAVEGTAYPALTASVVGPTTVGTHLTYNYTLNASGGPAYGFNGTEVGSLTFSASVIGANTTGVTLNPTAGAMVKGSSELSLATSNLTQTLTLNIEVTSGEADDNVSTNVSYTIVVILPYTVTATLQVVSALGTIPFAVVVLLDGTPVGSVPVPSLTGGATYQVQYSYVNAGLAPGWHTFALSLQNAHGLVVFSGGATEYTQSFYVASTPPNDTLWYVAGAFAFVVAIFISLTLFGSRRRGRKR